MKFALQIEIFKLLKIVQTFSNCDIFKLHNFCANSILPPNRSRVDKIETYLFMKNFKNCSGSSRKKDIIITIKT